jgi:conjugative relaxase-like TrwC/TraI family protein
MITPSVQTSLTNARRYFREHLRMGDYYTKDAAIEGIWYGEAAERLGLKGPVGEKEFLALCDGNNPSTGGTLTLRRNTTRKGEGTDRANRRVFFDFVYRPPKSVSILAFMEDDRRLNALR